MPDHYFVSDLHMFSRRSLAEAHEPALRAAASQAKTFVLGGDIFDFRWSTLSNTEATVTAAVNWLTSYVDSFPQCEFHFVLGNHDYNRRFIDALDALAAYRGNLWWHRCYLRLGDSLFLHGDVADKIAVDTSALLMRRQQWLHDENRGQLANWLYDLAITARLHHVAKLVNRNQRVAERLLRYAYHIGHSPETGLQHVYFGHTHCAMSHFPHGGLLFHNGGAPMRGLEFRIVPVELNGSLPPAQDRPVIN
jgi:UDP-2,3-diacylglucosamine pyrophosphatase LpxH